MAHVVTATPAKLATKQADGCSSAAFGALHHHCAIRGIRNVRRERVTCSREMEDVMERDEVKGTAKKLRGV
jgi:hypothetical protein